ncbi:nucleoside deaminase [Lentibacillus sediminis]|uniref:nucleoside deaminase n=1 Tax=Lentibacillus sediminis TaxID=1940529 RepID=UPI000C1C2C6F|nr:nucleoside deaminase [Lentibacillus sediminis]
MVNNSDLKHLRRCIELAKTALENGDEPFGSVLVSADGKVLAEDHNHVSGGDQTQHPEFALARWAAGNMTSQERAEATVYTSGEHCPMCAAAHGLVELGRIVYVSSSKQLAQWRSEMGITGSRVRNLSIQDVIRDTTIEGPVPDLDEEVHQLHRQFYTGRR